jgi:hypothetical protein
LKWKIFFACAVNWKKMGKRREREKENNEQEGWKSVRKKWRGRGAGHAKQTSFVSTCDFNIPALFGLGHSGLNNFEFCFWNMFNSNFIMYHNIFRNSGLSNNFPETPRQILKCFTNCSDETLTAPTKQNEF